MLDNLTSSIDTNSVQSANEVGNSVNAILREVADPLFEKHVVCSNTVSFSPSSCVNNAEWFDSVWTIKTTLSWSVTCIKPFSHGIKQAILLWM